SEQRSIWVVNRDGSGERQLVADTRAEPILIEFPLAWSPRGDALAYTTASCPEPCTATRVVIVDAQDGHRLGEIDRAESLRWSAFTRGRVWPVRPDGPHARRVTREALGRNCPIASFRRLRAGRPGRPPVGSCPTSPAAKEPCAAAGNPRLLSEAGNGHVPVR